MPNKIANANKGLKGKGKNELITYLRGGELTRSQAMSAACYQCMNYFADGRHDCGIESCPLYPWMPYTAKPKEKKRKLSEKQLSAMKKGRKK